jgi:hypothetical protein
MGTNGIRRCLCESHVYALRRRTRLRGPSSRRGARPSGSTSSLGSGLRRSSGRSSSRLIPHFVPPFLLQLAVCSLPSSSLMAILAPPICIRPAGRRAHQLLLSSSGALSFVRLPFAPRLVCTVLLQTRKSVLDEVQQLPSTLRARLAYSEMCPSASPRGVSH